MFAIKWRVLGSNNAYVKSLGAEILFGTHLYPDLNQAYQAMDALIANNKRHGIHQDVEYAVLEQ